jgi:PhnB protein
MGHRGGRTRPARQPDGDHLLVADPDRFAECAIANGAVEIAPIADQSYGLRQGRLADPFGHHWLIGRPLADERGDWARTPDR